MAILVALPGGGTVYTSFQAGGFFVGTPAVLAVIVGLALVARITLADAPFAGVGRAAGLATAALGLYCAWVLLSASWSDAPARAMLEFDRALLYWLLLVLFASLPRDDGRVAWATRGVALAMACVCAAALLTRLFPDAFELADAVANERLSFPLTYWNALGLLAGIAAVLLLHLTSAEREAPVVRILAAGAIPVVAATLYFTFSRGGMVAALLGVLVYAVVARPRGLVVALLAVGPPVAAVFVAAYGADLLAGDRPTTPAAAREGADVALVVAAAVIGAIALRAIGLLADQRLAEVRVSASARRRAGVGSAVIVAILLVVAVAGFDADGVLTEKVETFAEGGTPSESSDFRGRLTSVSNNGRIEQWEVALAGFRENPIAGDGAGTFVHRWNRERSSDLRVVDAHSLYIENLSELGIVGLALIAIVLVAVIGTFMARKRGAYRQTYAALFAVGVAWAVHAGIDWDWEMPAITLWLFALGGMALAQRSGASGDEPGPVVVATTGRSTRVVLSLGCLALLATPALMALSQGQLNRAVDAFKSGDCATATRAAVDAAKTAPARPEPYAVLGYCNSRAGNDSLAIRMFETAIARENASWESHYGLALVKAAAGEDPRPAVRAARRLNPREDLVQAAIERFDTDDPQRWRRRALPARLPIL